MMMRGHPPLKGDRPAMMISRTLFATRRGRMIGPLLCLVAAALAIVVADGAKLILASGFLLLAVLFRVSAELSGRHGRLKSHIACLEVDLEAITALTGPQGERFRDLEASVADSTTRLDSSFLAIAELEERQEELDGRLSRIVEVLQPIKRYRLEASEDTPDLTLRTSTRELLRRWRQEPGS